MRTPTTFSVSYNPAVIKLAGASRTFNGYNEKERSNIVYDGITLARKCVEAVERRRPEPMAYGGHVGAWLVSFADRARALRE